MKSHTDCSSSNPALHVSCVIETLTDEGRCVVVLCFFR